MKQKRSKPAFKTAYYLSAYHWVKPENISQAVRAIEAGAEAIELSSRWKLTEEELRQLANSLADSPNLLAFCARGAELGADKLGVLLTGLKFAHKLESLEYSFLGIYNI
eukprot:snap_masked-scaffold_12-processed-gene-10.36-mRNA-1 protein AED:1.00 eAED:1.00 QI:0/0/0/0/1/1/2/0/108